MAWPKLSPHQVEVLFALVRYQLRQGRDVVFEIGGGWDVEIYPWRQAEVEEKITCPKEVVDLLSELGFVQLGMRGIGGGPLSFEVKTLLLRQEAIEYYRWMRKPPVYRWLVEQWETLKTEIRSAIIAIVVSILTFIITRWLSQ